MWSSRAIHMSRQRIADDRGIGRRDHHVLELGAPVVHVERERPSDIVRVVRVSVVGRTLRHDRFERGRAHRRGLKGGKAAPGDAAHAHGAIRPSLPRKPRNHLDRIVLLLLQVLIDQEPVRLAGAADVHAREREPIGNEGARPLVVAAALQIALAVRNVFEDDRYRRAVGAQGNPLPDPEPGAVLERDPFVLDRSKRLFLGHPPRPLTRLITLSRRANAHRDGTPAEHETASGHRHDHPPDFCCSTELRSVRDSGAPRRCDQGVKRIQETGDSFRFRQVMVALRIGSRAINTPPAQASPRAQPDENNARDARVSATRSRFSASLRRETASADDR